MKERNDYDYLNPAYLARKDQNEKLAPALIVHAGCPAVSAKKPGLTDKNEIHNLVRQLLPETILEIIALTIVASGISLEQRANFTSTSASET